MPADSPVTPPGAPDASAPSSAPPIYRARIDPAGSCFDAPANLSLLQSAERSGLAVRSSCRNGTCRACIAQLLDGEVTYRIEWPGLSADEKKAGCILPCVALPLSDVTWTVFESK
jgi:ferredoxin